MKFIVKLFDTTKKASDGSLIPRTSCEKYLQSDDYKQMINGKLGIGGRTHKDRKVDPKYQGLIGPDDQLWITNNATHYYTRLFFKDNDNFLYAEAETFDPTQYSGERADNIRNLIADLKMGMKLPVSVVIQAMWSPSDVAEEICRIKGFDFTSNPSFEGAGLVKVMSGAKEKSFSDTGFEQSTKMYSMEASIVEVIPGKGERIYSKQELIDKYGIFSEQVKAFNLVDGANFNEDQLNTIINVQTKEQAEKLIDKLSDLGDNVDELIAVLNDLKFDGDPAVLNSIFNANKMKLIPLIKSVPMDDPNRKELLQIKIDEYLRNNPLTAMYSTVSSVKDRLRFLDYPRYAYIRKLIIAYKTYYKSVGSMSESKKIAFMNIIISDINLLIRKVAKYIKNGVSLTALYGLHQFNDEICEKANQLSSVYRKVMIIEMSAGYVPKDLYDDWILKLRSFYQSIIDYVTFGDLQLNDSTYLDNLKVK